MAIFLQTVAALYAMVVVLFSITDPATHPLLIRLGVQDPPSVVQQIHTFVVIHSWVLISSSIIFLLVYVLYRAAFGFRNKCCRRRVISKTIPLEPEDPEYKYSDWMDAFCHLDQYLRPLQLDSEAPYYRDRLSDRINRAREAVHHATREFTATVKRMAPEVGPQVPKQLVPNWIVPPQQLLSLAERKLGIVFVSVKRFLLNIGVRIFSYARRFRIFGKMCVSDPDTDYLDVPRAKAFLRSRPPISIGSRKYRRLILTLRRNRRKLEYLKVQLRALKLTRVAVLKQNNVPVY